jgi:hypothetical protein
MQTAARGHYAAARRPRPAACHPARLARPPTRPPITAAAAIAPTASAREAAPQRAAERAAMKRRLPEQEGHLRKPPRPRSLGLARVLKGAPARGQPRAYAKRTQSPCRSRNRTAQPGTPAAFGRPRSASRDLEPGARRHAPKRRRAARLAGRSRLLSPGFESSDLCAPSVGRRRPRPPRHAPDGCHRAGPLRPVARGGEAIRAFLPLMGRDFWPRRATTGHATTGRRLILRSLSHRVAGRSISPRRPLQRRTLPNEPAANGSDGPMGECPTDETAVATWGACLAGFR